MSTHYETLGVSESASADEIKKAYRKLAKMHHPDVNKGDLVSEAKFKEISAAYDILSSDQKRQEYDLGLKNPGGSQNWGFNMGGGGMPPDLEEMLNQMFKQQGHPGFHRAPQKNRDVTINMTVTLEEAFKGKSAPIKFKTPAGREIELLANVPAGVDTGLRVRYQGQGENINSALPAGDLYVQIIVVNHPLFERHGNDLHTIAEIDSISAIVGTKHRITCIDDNVIDVAIPANTQPGAFFRVPGKGMIERGGSIRGDMILHIKLVTPINLSQDHLKILTEIQKSRGITTKDGDTK